MPDGPSDFVSYQELLGLNADEVTRAKQRAQEEYDASMGDANNALARAGTEARNAARQGAGGGLTQTGSYSDYLKARTQAQTAYTRLRGGGGGRGMDAALAAGAADGGAQDPGLTLDAQEGRLDAWAGDMGQQGRNERASAAEWGRRDTAEKQAEADKREAWRQQMMGIERDRLMKASGALDKAHGGAFRFFVDPVARFGSMGGVDSRGDSAAPDLDRYGRNIWTGMTAAEVDSAKRRYAQYGGTDGNSLYSNDAAGSWQGGKWTPNAPATNARDAAALLKRKAGG